MIVFDTTRGDRCGFVGYGRDTTPVLDRLAQEGAAFTNAWSPAGWTGPAHGSLFTGLRPEHHRLYLDAERALPDEAVTLAERLRDAGYRTAAFSCNSIVSAQFGLVQGFERAQIVQGADRAVDSLAEEAQRLTREWIAAAPGPWFAFVNVMEPHLPYTPPWQQERRFVRPGIDAQRLSALRAFDFPYTMAHVARTLVVSDPDLAVLSDLYDAEIATADAAMGRLVDALDARGDLDRTVLVVAGDHGENLGEHGLVTHRFSLHRTIRHVPLLLRYPPRITPGRVERRIVRLEDVFPTVLDLCGLARGEDLDGATLLGDVGERVAPAIQGAVPVEFRERVRTMLPNADLEPWYGSMRAVLSGRLHLIRYDDGREELYDVVADPGETRDLAESRADVAGDLRRLLPLVGER